MKRVYVYCEGQTEESFVKRILEPYFMNMNIWVIPVVCSTKRTSQQKFKGGVSRYEKIRNELFKLCRSHRKEFITTMFDYYGMPDNTPGIDNNEPDLYKKIAAIEQEITTDIGEPNCKFNLIVHEFEGLLFSRPESFAIIADDIATNRIKAIRNAFETPEHINNSIATAPSKRIQEVISSYAKVRDGTLLSLDMGVDVIANECKHFRDWLTIIKDS